VIRPFHLLRLKDLSGVSGEGIIADGIRHDEPWVFEFPDGVLSFSPGWCELTWRGALTSTSLWRSVDAMMEVHGHDGATRLIWGTKPDG
jgi:hypothetical protein